VLSNGCAAQVDGVMEGRMVEGAMRRARRCTLSLLLLLVADLVTSAPGVFSWESSNLFVDAILRAVAQRETTKVPTVAHTAREPIEAKASLHSRTRVPVVRERLVWIIARSDVGE
jgi:hypothetical protein